MREFRRQVTARRLIVVANCLAIWAVAIFQSVRPVAPLELRLYNHSGATQVVRVLDVGRHETSLVAAPSAIDAYVLLTIERDANIQAVETSSCRVTGELDLGQIYWDSGSFWVEVDESGVLRDATGEIPTGSQVASIPAQSSCTAYAAGQP
jgi:hypothetical protein